MHARSLAVIARLLAAVTFVPIAACSDDDDGTDPTSVLVGSWTFTSLSGLGQDFIALGMDLELELTSAETYTFTVTNDMVEFCDPGPDCTVTGDYTATASTITLDPTDEPTTFTWAISGNTMTWTGSIGGTPATAVMTRN